MSDFTEYSPVCSTPSLHCCTGYHLHATITYQASYEPLSSIDPCINLTMAVVNGSIQLF